MVDRSSDTEAPEFVPWDEFAPRFVELWEQGEHVALIGPTGTGKTTLGLYLLQERARRRGAEVLILATKPRDATLHRLGWPIIRSWPPGYGQEQVILWPTFGDPATAARRQRAVFEPVLRQVFAEGNRTVYFDEEGYFEDELALKTLIRHYWNQGRSLGLTVVAGTQRPARVVREMFANPSFVFLWKMADEAELRRIAEIGGTDAQVVRAAVRELGPHEFLVVRSRTGDMIRSQVGRTRPPT